MDIFESFCFLRTLYKKSDSAVQLDMWKLYRSMVITHIKMMLFVLGVPFP